MLLETPSIWQSLRGETNIYTLCKLRVLHFEMSHFKSPFWKVNILYLHILQAYMYYIELSHFLIWCDNVIWTWKKGNNGKLKIFTTFKNLP